MSREPSWRAVADALARRMYLHAFCEAHAPDEAVPEDCPFCADRAAYLMWAAKSGRRHVAPKPAGVHTDINVLRGSGWPAR